MPHEKLIPIPRQCPKFIEGFPVKNGEGMRAQVLELDDTIQINDREGRKPRWITVREYFAADATTICSPYGRYDAFASKVEVREDSKKEKHTYVTVNVAVEKEGEVTAVKKELRVSQEVLRYMDEQQLKAVAPELEEIKKLALKHLETMKQLQNPVFKNWSKFGINLQEIYLKHHTK